MEQITNKKSCACTHDIMFICGRMYYSCFLTIKMACAYHVVPNDNDTVQSKTWRKRLLGYLQSDITHPSYSK
jgi:hypothetical protein